MHLFLLDADYKVTRQYDRGYLMQYSDNVDMVFFAIDGATETKPDNQVAALSGNPGNAKEKLLLMMNWDSYVYQGRTLWGWSAVIPETFTQIAGPLVLNGVVTDTSTEQVIFTTTITLTVNPASSDVPWNEAMNYAQWKELISYFAAPGQAVTIDDDQIIYGEKTFAGGLNVQSGGSTTSFSADGIQSGDNTYTFPVKEAGEYVFAMTSDVATALQDAKDYADDLISGADLEGYAKLASDNEFTGKNTFNKNSIAIGENVGFVARKAKEISSVDEISDLTWERLRVRGTYFLPGGIRLSNNSELIFPKKEDFSTHTLATTEDIPTGVAVLANENTFTNKNTFTVTEEDKGGTETTTIDSYGVTVGGYAEEKAFTQIRKGGEIRYAKDGEEYDRILHLPIDGDISDDADYYLAYSKSENGANRDVDNLANLSANNEFTGSNTFKGETKTNKFEGIVEAKLVKANIETTKIYSSVAYQTTLLGYEMNTVIVGKSDLSASLNLYGNGDRPLYFAGDGTSDYLALKGDVDLCATKDELKSYAKLDAEVGKNVFVNPIKVGSTSVATITGTGVEFLNNVTPSASYSVNFNTDNIYKNAYSSDGKTITKSLEWSYPGASGTLATQEYADNKLKNYVDLTSAQTINGKKTFSEEATFGGKIVANSQIDAGSGISLTGTIYGQQGGFPILENDYDNSQIIVGSSKKLLLEGSEDKPSYRKNGYSTSDTFAFTKELDAYAKLSGATFSGNVEVKNTAGESSTISPTSIAVGDSENSPTLNTTNYQDGKIVKTWDGTAKTLAFPNDNGVLATQGFVNTQLESYAKSDDLDAYAKLEGATFTGTVEVEDETSKKYAGVSSSGFTVGDSEDSQTWSGTNYLEGSIKNVSNGKIANLTLPTSDGTLATQEYGKTAYVTLTDAQEVSGAKTFNGKVVCNSTAGGNVSLSVNHIAEIATLKTNHIYTEDGDNIATYDKASKLLMIGNYGVTKDDMNLYANTVTVQGDLTVKGTFTKVDAQTLSTKEYTIGLASRNTTAITTYVGLYATKYDGTNDGALVWDNTGTAYVGDCSVDENGKVTNVSMQPLMTRDASSSLSDGDLFMWDATNSKATKAQATETIGSLEIKSDITADTVAVLTKTVNTFTGTAIFKLSGSTSGAGSAISDGGVLVSGGNNKPQVFVSNDKITYSPVTSDTDTEYEFTFPTSGGVFATQNYVTTQLGSYAKLSGATFTGTVTAPTFKQSDTNAAYVTFVDGKNTKFNVSGSSGVTYNLANMVQTNTSAQLKDVTAYSTDTVKAKLTTNGVTITSGANNTLYGYDAITYNNLALKLPTTPGTLALESYTDSALKKYTTTTDLESTYAKLASSQIFSGSNTFSKQVTISDSTGLDVKGEITTSTYSTTSTKYQSAKILKTVLNNLTSTSKTYTLNIPSANGTLATTDDAKITLSGSGEGNAITSISWNNSARTLSYVAGSKFMLASDNHLSAEDATIG